MLHDDNIDQDMKDKILEQLIEKMEDLIGGGLKDRSGLQDHSGLAVEVQAPDKDKLAEGLDKAKDVVSESPLSLDKPEEPKEDDQSDEDRLMELMGDEGSSSDDEKDKEKDKFRR